MVPCNTGENLVTDATDVEHEARQDGEICKSLLHVQYDVCKSYATYNR